MSFERTIAGFFRLDDEAWICHANPLSVIMRNTILPVLIIAFWSRFWLKQWAVVPVFFALLWAWLNPQIFTAPQSLDHWTSKGVLGERVGLNRDIIPVPVYHRNVPNILSAVSSIGIVFIIWGVLVFDPWPTMFGTMIVYLGKLWFLDRMVWLWKNMQGCDGGVPGMAGKVTHNFR